MKTRTGAQGLEDRDNLADRRRRDYIYKHVGCLVHLRAVMLERSVRLRSSSVVYAERIFAKFL